MRFAIGALLLAIALVFQLRMSALSRRMRQEVNEALPGDSRIPSIGLSTLRGEVIKLHRQFFPASRLRKQVYWLWSLEMAAFVAALAFILRFVK